MKKVFDNSLFSARIAPTKENKMKTEQKAKNNSRNLPQHIISTVRVNIYCIILARRRAHAKNDPWSYCAGHEAGVMIAYHLANKTLIDSYRIFGSK